MIVGPMIENDDLEVASLQHDIYAEALGIILFGCNAHARHAVRRQRLWDRYSCGLRESFCSS